MPTLERLLTVPEAARLAGISPRTFWKLISTAQTPEVVRIGRCVRLRASDIDRWLGMGCPNRDRFDAAKELAAGGRG